MLTFDAKNSSLVYAGCAISGSTRLEDLTAQLAGESGDIHGQPGWSRFATRGEALNASISFYQDCVHSGYFWADVPGRSWDDLETSEAARRAKHAAIITRMFGADSFADDRLEVSLARDPRSALETIAFAFR
ncbi:hypothetical protein ACSBM8_11080 [Sphingomonas sp. ASY06-1R]|jgi:hypothetical protein|uniref:hypothetical protein n=1 Tax=Sphingomonas sp. ASY06-1R TaxID=3445771 RepID=UPI003FA22595